MQVIYPLGDGYPKPEELKIPELKDLKLQLVELDKRLLTLRFAFGYLKTTMTDAFTPLATVLLPVLNRALYAAAGMVKTVGQVIAGLLGVQVAQDKVTKSVKRTTAATKALAKASLATFDQINRLQAKAAGGSAGTGLSDEETQKLFPSGLTEAAQNILAALSPLRDIDLEPARWAFLRLRDALLELATVAGDNFKRLWLEVLVPLIEWVAEKLAPAVLRALDGAAQLAADLAEVLGDSFFKLVESMQPVAEFFGQLLVDAIERLRTFFLDAANSIHNDGSQIKGTFDSLAQLVENFWTVAKPWLERVVELFSAAFDSIGQYAIDGIENALMAIGYFFYALTALINGDFEGFWDGIEKMSTHGANAIIAVFNGLLEAVAAAVNAIFAALNKVTIDIPGWVPVYGGKKFKFDLKPVKAHTIPYLAQGAVLPANQPFLAVVGDQKHGTNIEAPLATIQQAVALTMEDLAAQNAAGQEATVTVLTQILQAVLGISIGDEQLAAAVDRYHSHAAVMRGGNGWN